MGQNENPKQYEITEIKTHPAIEAFIEVFGDFLDTQIDLLEKSGARIRNHGIIFQRKEEPPHMTDDSSI